MTLNELMTEAGEFYGECQLAFKMEEGSVLRDIETVSLRTDGDHTGLIVLLGFPLPLADECGDC